MKKWFFFFFKFPFRLLGSGVVLSQSSIEEVVLHTQIPKDTYTHIDRHLHTISPQGVFLAMISVHDCNWERLWAGRYIWWETIPCWQINKEIITCRRNTNSDRLLHFKLQKTLKGFSEDHLVLPNISAVYLIDSYIILIDGGGSFSLTSSSCLRQDII